MTLVNNLIVTKDVPVNAKAAFMHVNIILTFETWNEYGENQEFFDLHLQVSKKEANAVQFMDNKFFKRVVKKCKQLNRSVGDLIKISTASNWSLFTEVTKLESLMDLGHDGKWYFGKGRNDLDSWEKDLVDIYGFGIDADLSYMNGSWTQEQLLEKIMSESKTRQKLQAKNI